MNQTPTNLEHLRKELGDEVRSWKQPDLPVIELRDRNDFFLATSSLQKSIRRNLEIEAMTYALALARQYSRYLARRLAVIALEDVGHGDLAVVEQAVLIASEPGLREQLGVERILVWLAGRLAAAPGDRSACELEVVATSHPALRDDLIAMRGRAELLSFLARAPLVPIEALQITASMVQLEQRGWFAAALNAVAPLLDPRARWIAETAHGIGVEGLEHGFLASALLFQRRVPQAAQTPLETPRLGPWLGCALDQHTRAGVRAIERFAVRCEKLARLLRAVPPRRRTSVAGSLVFGAEGGLLSRKVTYSGSYELTRWDAEASLASAGAPIQILDEAIAIVQANLAQLHEIRQGMLPDRWRSGGPGDL